MDCITKLKEMKEVFTKTVYFRKFRKYKGNESQGIGRINRDKSA